MTIVVDSSVALKWVLQEPESDAAIALQAERLIAPSLWLIEAANALWRHARLGQITTEQAVESYAELSNAPVASLPSEAHLPAALRLAINLRHPIHDCVYLAVALHHDTHVVTADRRFAAAAAGAHPGRVRLLAPQ